jgi:Flp pilus assembly protein TadG
MTRPCERDRGSVTTEMVIMVPVAIALLCLVALVGRTTTARQVLDGAARDASRAASLQRDSTSAQQTALGSADTAISESGLRCVSVTVELDTSRFEPGGQVTAHVACDISLSDLGLLGLPGSRRVSATATSVLDTYRATR